MNMRSSTATALVLALWTGAFHNAATAQEAESDYIKKHAPPGITRTFYACVDKANTNAVASGACLTAEHDYQDKRLNVAYKKLLNALGEKDRPSLVAAERAWLGLQDKDGVLETVIYGEDTVSSLQQDQNEVFRICERANVMERYLDIVKSK